MAFLSHALELIGQASSGFSVNKKAGGYTFLF
jgi:hypothetical protein